MPNKFFKDLERLINKIFDSRKVFDAKEEKRKKKTFYVWLNTFEKKLLSNKLLKRKLKSES